MGDKRYKIYNDNNFPIGIKLQNPVREQNIGSKSFALLTSDEIAFVDSVSTLFKRGMLVCKDDEINQMLGYVEVNKNVITEKEIEQLLKGKYDDMVNRLEQLDENYAKAKVVEVFKRIGANLTMKKGKWLRDFVGKELYFDEIT